MIRSYFSFAVAAWFAMSVVGVLSGCAGAKKGANAEIVTEGVSAAPGTVAPPVRDGSGKVVSDAAKECVSTGQSQAGEANAADCGAHSPSATTAAPAPTISAPVAAIATPAAEPAVQAAPAPAPKLEITKGEVVNAAPKLEELSLQAEAVFKFGKSDSASLLPAAKARLDDLAARITRSGAQAVSKITVTGHADRLGLDAANQSLSRRRAETVRQYLASKGVPTALLQVSAKGESAPIVQCKGDKPTIKLKACLAPNRRVEVVVYGQ
jgi:outer membrane protein OmpA-like peptidoglycan-associated protein